MATPVYGTYQRKTIAGPGRVIIGLTIEGTEALAQALNAFGSEAPQQLGGALYRKANVIMTEAKRQTPVDLGHLRASGHVALPAATGETLSVTLGFGGPAGVGNHGGETNPQEVGYAVIVHEDLQAWHAVGGAKYLERPMLEAAKTMEQDLAADLRTWAERHRAR